MMKLNPNLARNLRNFIHKHPTPRCPSLHFHIHHNLYFQSHSSKTLLQNPNSSLSSFVSGFHRSLKTSSSVDLSFATRLHYSTATINASTDATHREKPQDLAYSDSNDEVEPIDIWEEEDETDPEIGDGGSGGGVVLHNCPWGEKALSIAQQVLRQFGDDIEIFSFKTSPRGYIYVRLDRLCNEYGCPSMDDMQRYNHEYKKKLDEAGAAGDIPSDLALEVSSPGADRLLIKPDDLRRFKDMAMRVKYLEHGESRSLEKEGIFFLEAIEMESGSCVWRLADVKENRSPLSKGRPLTRKQKDWRLELPYDMLKRVTLYLDYH